MATTYFLLFLLCLVAMVSTTTTADKTGASAALDHPSQKLTAFPARTKHHKSKSIKRSLIARAPDEGPVGMQVQEKLNHRGSRLTMENLEEKAREGHVVGCLKNVDGTWPAGCLSGARKEIVAKSNVGREIMPKNRPENEMKPKNRPENEPVFFVRGGKKLGMKKLDWEATKDKRTGYRTKMTNVRKAEGMRA